MGPEAVGFRHAGFPRPTLKLCHSSCGSTGTNVCVICGWAAASPLQKSPGRRWLLLPSGNPSSLPWTSTWPVKCPLSKPPKYPKTEQECSCYLRCSVRFAEGMDYSWVLNQTLRILHTVLAAHLLLNTSSFLFLKQLQWCPKWQMDQTVWYFAYLTAMKDDSFLNIFQLLYSCSSHQL